MTHPEWFPSPIKINLFLHVTGRRPDGYHLLQTIFQFLDYGDEIGFEISENGLIERIDHHNFDLPEVDLCIEAANSLKRHSHNPKLGARIHLRKIIPPGTGLGAGSSNAATVLIMLNQLWGVGLSVDKLIQIGKELGADIPVFIHGHATWAEGIGDQFSDCTPPTGWVCVALPDAQVSTSDAFSDPHLRRDHAAVDWKDFISGQTGNDLEPSTCQTFPEVADALTHLKSFGNARMSGTGSAVFVCVDDQTTAKLVLDSLPDNINGFITQSANQSLLLRTVD